MTRSTSSRVWKVLLGLLAAFLVLFFLAEVGIRMFIAQQIKSSYRDSAPESVVMEDDAKVFFGATPVLFGLASGKLNHIQIDLPSTLTPDSANIVGNPAATIEADGFYLDQDDPRTDEMTLTTQLPQALVRDILQQQLAGALEDTSDGRYSDFNGIVTVSDVTTDGANGTFTITFSNGAFSVELRPELVNEQLSFTAESTRLLGRALPDFFSSGVTEAFRRGLNEDVTGPLEIRQFRVTDGGFDVTVHGKDVHLNELPV